jgi:hypothetical protein
MVKYITPLYWVGTFGVIVSEMVLIVAGMFTFPFGIILWLAAAMLSGWWGEVLKAWVARERLWQAQRTIGLLEEAHRSNPVDFATNAQHAPWN